MYIFISMVTSFGILEAPAAAPAPIMRVYDPEKEAG